MEFIFFKQKTAYDMRISDWSSDVCSSDRLEARREAAQRGGRDGTGLVGVNLGANKDSADRPGDYAIGYERLAPLCDFAVVNVSSPNTIGLRNLQGRDEMTALLARLKP